MAFEKIKTEWAAVKSYPEGAVAVCAKTKGSFVHIGFENLQALKEAIDGKKISVKKWVISVPDECCIFKVMELPADNLEQAYKMVEYELASLVPVSSEKLVYGCTLLGDRENLLEILVCIMKTDTLENVLGPYRSIGIKPSRVIFDSAGLSCWFKTVSKQKDDVVINVLVGESRCQTVTNLKGTIYRFEEIQADADDIKTIQQAIAESARQVSELNTPLDGPIAVNLAAPKNIIAEIREGFEKKQSFVSDKVDIYQCPEIINFSGKPDFKRKTLLSATVITEGAVESVTNVDLEYLNILPRGLLSKAQQKVQLTNYAITAALSFLLILALWSNFALANQRISGACHRIQEQIAPIADIATEIESKRYRVKAIQKQLSNRGQISRIFAELYKLTPKAISINELEFISKASGASINIKGQAESLSNAFEYPESMKKANMLKNVQIIDAQQIPRPGGSIVEFKAVCSLENE